MPHPSEWHNLRPAPQPQRVLPACEEIPEEGEEAALSFSSVPPGISAPPMHQHTVKTHQHCSQSSQRSKGKELLRAIASETNLFYEFKSLTLQREFRTFALQYGQGPAVQFLCVMMLLVTLIFLPQSVLKVYYDTTPAVRTKKEYSLAIASSSLSLLCALVCVVIGWLLYLRQKNFHFFVEDSHCAPLAAVKNNNNNNNNSNPSAVKAPPLERKSSERIRFWSCLVRLGPLFTSQNIVDCAHCVFLCSVQLFLILTVCGVAFDANCPRVETMSHSDRDWFTKHLFLEVFGGNTCISPSFVTYTAPEISKSIEKRQFLGVQGMLLFFLPVFFFKGLPQTPIRCIWLNWFLAVLSFFLSVFLTACDASVLSCGVVWMCISFFLVRDIQMRNLLIFLSTRDVEQTMFSQNKALEENHANEMRHLIANVAHDLKTPLASFTTGLDFIELALNESESLRTSTDQRHVSTSSRDTSSIASIRQCLANIRNTNMFMLMTINRCIDYTKASKGIQLMSRRETIDLLDTIQLPLMCMRNIQSKVDISLRPLAKEICPHIITDRLWLQENLLCLLSNAVKYSTAGEVTITLRIGHEFSDPHTHSHSHMQPYAYSVSHSHSYDMNAKSVDSGPCVNLEPGCVVSKRSLDEVKRSLSLSFDEYTRNEDRERHIHTQKYTQTESPSLSSSSCTARMNFLVVEVEDTGIGMTDAAMDMLFKPFNQTQRMAGGTGLGLFSLAKRMEALKGKYGVRRRKDGRQGSLFWFAIPYVPDETMVSLCTSFDAEQDDTSSVNCSMMTRSGMLPSPTKKRIEKSLSFSSLSPRGGNRVSFVNDKPQKTIPSRPHNEKSKRISSRIPDSSKKPPDILHVLVVDDSPAILKMTSMMLRKLGHVVSTAENGQIAVDAIQREITMSKKEGEAMKNRFDLVLMDLQMPVMDGLEATKRIREMENADVSQSSHRHWIVGCSANSDAETMEAGLSVGMDLFVAKPFNVNTFRQAVAELFSTPSSVSIRK